jgi:hypothetical protein
MKDKSEWIPVGALGDAFQADNHCLPQVGDLAGKSMTLNFENGWTIRHDFGNGGSLQWLRMEGGVLVEQGCEQCVVTRPRDGIYFVDFVKSAERATSVSLVLNLVKRTFLAVIGQLPVAEEVMIPFIKRIELSKELTAVDASFLRGCVDVTFDANADLPAVTSELLGLRVEYTYSPLEKYEHIYLNDKFYAWRCIRGSEKGLGDTDACHYYKIADRLYLFVWREKIVPTIGVVMVNLEAMKTTGKIMGYEHNDFGSVRNFGVGAYARILSVIPAE